VNEQDLREALRDAMTDAAPPRPVTADAALTRAQRAQRARRANIAGLGVGVAVVALVAGAFTVPSRTLLDPSASSATTPSPTSPTGHGDRTQTSGPQNDKSVQLLDALDGVLPYPIQRATEEQAKGAQIPLRMHQAQVEDWDTNTWNYEAAEAVAPAGAGVGVGKVIVEVHGPGNTIPTDPCAMAKGFWGGMGVDCQEVQVVGKHVGLVQRTTSGGVDSIAAYRYPDGTVVYLAQSKSYIMSGTAALTKPPLTDDQLVNLVLTPGFKVVP
jgi:hypothetical protein